MLSIKQEGSSAGRERSSAGREKSRVTRSRAPPVGNVKNEAGYARGRSRAAPPPSTRTPVSLGNDDPYNIMHIEALDDDQEAEPPPPSPLSAQSESSEMLLGFEVFASQQPPDRIGAKIIAHPRVRPLEFVSGKRMSVKTGNINAALTYTRGREITGADVCTRCALGKSVFQKCVVMDGLHKGSCAGCAVHHGASLCSFRTQAPPPPQYETEPAPAISNSAPNAGTATEGPPAPAFPPGLPPAHATDLNSAGETKHHRVSLRVNLKDGTIVSPTQIRSQQISQQVPEGQAQQPQPKQNVPSRAPSRRPPVSILKPYSRPQAGSSSASANRAPAIDGNEYRRRDRSMPARPNSPGSVANAKHVALQKRYMELAGLIQELRKDQGTKWEKIDAAMGALGKDLM